MIQWIIDALNQSKQVENIVVVGLPIGTKLKSNKPVYYLEGGNTLMGSITNGMRKIVEIKPDTDYCLVVSTDIPAITGEMVDWIIDSANKPGIDIFYNVIPRQVMESQFPESKRSYIQFKDITVCSGDMQVFTVQKSLRGDSIWTNIVESRKFPFRQMVIIGFDLLFRMIFKKPTIEEAAKLVSKRLGIVGQVVISPYAEIGMDVDKPHQLQMVENALKKRTN